MIELILKNANKGIESGARSVDALKTSCNQALAYVSESRNDGEFAGYYVTVLSGNEYPVSVQEGKWVQGWI